VIERVITVVRARIGSPLVPLDDPHFDVLRRELVGRAAARVRRLRRVRRAAADAAARVERAIVQAMMDVPAELQPGLFDRRAVHASDEAAGERAELERALDDRLRECELEASIDVGTPVLELIGVVRRTP
jgi:hypothetical protein